MIGVSVIIPTINRYDVLRDAIEDILKQTYELYEIIVVDQSDDVPEWTQEITAQNADKMRYFKDVDFKGLPQARNFGMAQAKYEVILYIDDDIRTEPTLVAQHAKCYVDKQIGMVGGGIELPGYDNDSEPAVVGKFNSWTATPIQGFHSKKELEVDHVQGCNFSIRTELMRQIGGIDEVLARGAALYEELEMCLRVRKAGYKIWFNGNARLLHLVSTEGGCRVKDIKKYMWGFGHNRSRVIAKNLTGLKKFTALGRLMLFGVSFSRAYKTTSAFSQMIKGMREGLH
ncbi:MAG: glycosyltransferase family 2 protein [Fibrobacterales bacterium]